MALVNIPSTNVDPDYRYKMPPLICKLEGRGNGIKTCIVNMGDVARALKSPPQYATKWLGCELGVKSEYIDKEGGGERCLIDGSHDVSAFAGLLDEFIEKYICCEQCHLPELDVYTMKGIVCGKCKACGWADELDNDHSVARFIMKNPPDESGLRLKACGGGKVMKKGAKKLQVMELDSDFDDDDDDGDNDLTDDAASACSCDEQKAEISPSSKKMRSPSKEKKEKRDTQEGISPSGTEKKDKKEMQETTSPNKSPSKEKHDKKEKKMKKEKKEKKDKKEKKAQRMGSKDTCDDDSEPDEDTISSRSDNVEKIEIPEMMYGSRKIKTVVKTLRNYVEKSGVHMSVDDFFDELRLVQLAEVLDHKMRLYVALEALLGPIFDAHSVVAKKEYLAKAINIDGTSMSFSDILWAFGAYIEAHPSAANGWPWVLKTIYDEDWVNEVDILEYYGSDEFRADPGFLFAQSHASPFLRWLATVDSADEDDDGE